jgi:hypothetical protein
LSPVLATCLPSSRRDSNLWRLGVPEDERGHVVDGQAPREIPSIPSVPPPDCRSAELVRALPFRRVPCFARSALPVRIATASLGRQRKVQIARMVYRELPRSAARIRRYCRSPARERVLEILADGGLRRTFALRAGSPLAASLELSCAMRSSRPASP